MSVHENVSMLAKNRNISLCELEKKAGLASGCISKWKNINPTVKNLKSVADVLGTTVDKLLEEKTEG